MEKLCRKYRERKLCRKHRVGKLCRKLIDERLFICYDGNTKNKQMFVKVGENIAFLLYGMYNIGKETLWGKKMDIQWHLGFCAAMELELREYADRLEFHRNIR